MQTRSAASDQDLHCLPLWTSLLKLKWRCQIPPNTPIIVNGIVFLMEVGKSIRLKCNKKKCYWHVLTMKVPTSMYINIELNRTFLFERNLVIFFAD